MNSELTDNQQNKFRLCIEKLLRDHQDTYLQKPKFLEILCDLLDVANGGID